MILWDVNVLIYAFRSDSDRHTDYRRWLVGVLDSPPPFGVSELVLSAFVRIVTNPRAFRNPDPLDDAFEFCHAIVSRPQHVRLVPGPRHWHIFRELSRSANAKGNMISDAYFAALAIEHDCEWHTADRDYARFPGLRWKHPLA